MSDVDAAGWSAADIPSQQGRLAIVTGTGGLGYEAALALVRAGAEVILAGRNPDKGTESVARIVTIVPQAKIRFEMVDLGQLASIEAFAGRLQQAASQLDVLINNAGVMMPKSRQLTADGFELQFGTNYLGHFALTGRLLPLLRKAPAPRVVSVTSTAHRTGRIDFANLQAERSYNGFKTYAQSKMAQVMFALELQRRSDAQGWGLMSNAAHPGWARTELFHNGPGTKSFTNWLNDHFVGPYLGQSPAGGALPMLFAATAPTAIGGAYYGPSGLFEMKGPPHRAKIVAYAQRADIAEQLWQVSEKLTHVRY